MTAQQIYDGLQKETTSQEFADAWGQAHVRAMESTYVKGLDPEKMNDLFNLLDQILNTENCWYLDKKIVDRGRALLDETTLI